MIAAARMRDLCDSCHRMWHVPNSGKYAAHLAFTMLATGHTACNNGSPQSSTEALGISGELRKHVCRSRAIFGASELEGGVQTRLQSQ